MTALSYRNLIALVATVILINSCRNPSGPSGHGASRVWIRTYGGNFNDAAYCINETRDYGYIVTGSKMTTLMDNSSIYLIRLKCDGDTLWTREYCNSGYNVGYSVIEASDGGFVIAGIQQTSGMCNPILMKTDAVGTLLWFKTYEIGDGGMARTVQQTLDGGFIIAGEIWSFESSADFLLIKTDEYGDTLWTRTYGGSCTDKARSVYQTSDGGYLVAGYSGSFTQYGEAYLVKTDSNGDTIWTKVYDQGGIWSAKEVSDNTYVLCGTYLYLIKVNSNGDILWSQDYDGPGFYQCAFSFVEAQDGGYIIAGAAESTERWNTDAYLVRTDAGGLSIWTKRYGGDGFDWANSITTTYDGSFVIAGQTDSFTHSHYDVYLVKFREY